MSLASTNGSFTTELSELMEHEKVIEQGLAGFMEVGSALLAIRDGRKYRAAGTKWLERAEGIYVDQVRYLTFTGGS